MNRIISHTLLILVIASTVQASIPSAQASFFGARNFGSNFGGPLPVEPGDFDGDGRVDAVIGYRNGVAVFFGDGNGGFVTPPTLAFETPTGSTPFPYAGDFNGDGRSDIVIRRRNPANQWSLAIYLGNADRTFSAPIFNAPMVVAEYYQMADLDNDGKTDIVGSGFSNDNFVVVAYMGNGAGGLNVGTAVSVPNYASPIVSDFNGDALPDLVYSDGNVDKIILNLGGGIFGTPSTINNGVQVLPNGVGDFNGDGIKDLVAINRNYDPENKIWLGTGEMNFVLASNLQIPSGTFVFLTAVTDLDGDGRTDLIFNTLNRILIRKGVGDGSFSTPIIYGEGGNGGMFVKDVNADGLPDIVTAQPVEWSVSGSGSISVMLNLQDMNFTSAPAFSTGGGTRDIAAADLDNNGLMDFVVANTNGGSTAGSLVLLFQSAGPSPAERKQIGAVESTAVAGVDPFCVRTGDFNQDGKQDIVVCGGPAGGGNQNLQILINQGNRNFISSFAQIGAGTICDLAIADLDGNGRVDLVTTSNDGVSVSPGNGNGTFGTSTPYLAGISSWAVAVGDLNGDSMIDIVTINVIVGKIAALLNNGNGTFTNAANPSIPGVPAALAVADMNSDGFGDIVLGKGVGISVLLGLGNGNFNAENNYPITPASANKIAVSDFNGDGKIDVAAAAGSNVVTVLLNDGSGVLGRETRWSAGVTLSALTSTDFNNDQKPDLIAGYTASQVGYSKILFNTTLPNESQSSVFCDFDGDGKTDPSVYRPSMGDWYLLNTTTGFRALHFGLPSDIMVPADYTGDGKTDMAVWRPSDSIWYVLRSEDNTFYGAGFGANGDVPAPGDYDGDGKADLVVIRPGASQSYWYLQQSTAGFAVVPFGLAGDVPTIGDYDGDGKNDVAVYRPSAGAWFRFNSSNGSFLGVGFGISGDKVVPADYTGDGKTDLAVFRPSNNIWYILRSEDNSLTGGAFGALGDLPSPGDYDGDGKADLAVYRPGATSGSQSVFYVLQTTAGFNTIPWGLGEDRPVPGAYVY